MKRIRIHLSETERTCAVDEAELQDWGRALIDDILFEAAKTISEQPGVTPVPAAISFRVLVDPEHTAIEIDH